MKKFALFFSLISLIGLTLAGCGGGGGSSSGTTTVTPVTPVTPVVTTYTVGGTVYGLASQSVVVSLSDNGGTPISSSNGTFTFTTGLDSGASYNVTVTPPSGVACMLGNASGTIASANVTNVTVTCQVIQPVVMACSNATIGTGNTAPLVVDGFPCAAGGTAGFAKTFNEPYTSVKVCAHGSTTNCQVIDHVIVDSGSTGFRVAATALNAALQPGVSGGLTPVAGSTGTVVTECEQYVASFVYGPVVTADIYMAGKSALNVPMQVFGGSSYPVPTGCSSSGGTSTNTTQIFGGNGLIGVSFDALDEGIFFNCANSTSASSCTTNNVYAGLPNTVEQFSGDNNGVVMALPPVGSLGSVVPVVGDLYFGVSTQSDNTPSGPTVAVTNDPTYGTFAFRIHAATGVTYGTAYIDSGTAVDYFNDSALLACSSASGYQGLYCPTTDTSVTFDLANTGTTAASSPAVGTFVYSVTSAANPNIPQPTVAISNWAGPTGSSSTAGSSSAMGLSSFYGHSFYFLFNGQTAPGTGLGGTSPTLVNGPVNAIQ